MELVTVDQFPEAVDGALHALGRRLGGAFRLIPARNEARHHRAEGPDSKAGLHRRSLTQAAVPGGSLPSSPSSLARSTSPSGSTRVSLWRLTAHTTVSLGASRLKTSEPGGLS